MKNNTKKWKVEKLISKNERLMKNNTNTKNCKSIRFTVFFVIGKIKYFDYTKNKVTNYMVYVKAYYL